MLVQSHSYDLLAPGFYERLGYETVGVIEGCPAGSTARWYRKDMEGRSAKRAWVAPKPRSATC